MCVCVCVCERERERERETGEREAAADGKLHGLFCCGLPCLVVLTYNATNMPPTWHYSSIGYWALETPAETDQVILQGIHLC